MIPILTEAFAKLARAEHHAGSLQAEVERWIATRSETPLSFSGEFQEDHNRFVYRVAAFSRDLPLDWSLIVGDALTNFRAALDYVAWRLVTIRSDQSPIAETQVQFPLIWRWPSHPSGHDRFVSEVRRRLPGVAGRYLEIIEAHQPYQWARHDVSNRSHSPHDYYASNVGRVDRHPLALLDRLSNHDKHRQLQVVAELGVAMRAEVVDQQNCEVLKLVPVAGQNRLAPGTEVLHVHVKRSGDARPRIKTRLELDIVAAFDPSIVTDPSLEITMALDVIGREVRSVLTDVANSGAQSLEAESGS